jgi:hypothetical protein
VTACGKELGDTGRLETGLGETHGGTQTRTTRTDHHGVVFVVHHGVISDDLIGDRAERSRCCCCCCCCKLVAFHVTVASDHGGGGLAGETTEHHCTAEYYCFMDVCATEQERLSTTTVLLLLSVLRHVRKSEASLQPPNMRTLRTS